MSPGLRLAPFDAGQLAAYLQRSRTDYVAERMAAGETAAEADANADVNHSRLFPGGAPAQGQVLGTMTGVDGPVGILWVGPAGDDPTRWWVWDIEVDEAVRGRGHGRAGMILAAQLAREAGATSLGLNVFAHNHVARGLYTSLGYAETSVQMRIDLTAEASDSR